MAAKDKEHQALFDKAHAAGMAAGQAHVPTPMIVGEAVDFFSDEIDYSKKTYYVPQGVCGFAWVNIAPATGSFAKWALKIGKAHKSYYGGADIWCHEFGQSMECKQAYASAFAAVLKDAGLKAYSQSRMD